MTTTSSTNTAPRVDRALIKTLTETWGPSGYEHRIRGLIRDIVTDLSDEVYVDALGNLVCRVGQGGKKIMIAAHMDEIGLMVNHVDKNGFLRFSPIGGLFPSTLVGNRCLFEDGTVGVIGVENMFGLTKLPTIEDYFIDVSTTNEVQTNIGVGSAAGMWREYSERGNRVVAKSMDDRIGCVVAIETMRQLKANRARLQHEVYFVFTVQEEVGVIGAKTGAQRITPDLGIALDVCATADQKVEDPGLGRLGKGAVINVSDAWHIVPPKFKELLIQRAEESNIPYQLLASKLGSTDAYAIQTAGGGVPSAVISIPCRYVHTVSETIDLNDVQACIDLVVTTLLHSLDSI